MSEDKICSHAVWESQCPICRAFTLTKSVSPNDYGALPDADNGGKPIQGPVGWICPVCGGGNSPFTSHCPCKPTQVTCGGAI